MKGQLRELIHQFNNLAQKFEDVAKTVDASTHLPALIAENKSKIAAHDLRITALETAESERRGAVKFGAVLVKVVPWSIPFAAFGGAAVLMAKVMGQ